MRTPLVALLAALAACSPAAAQETPPTAAAAAACRPEVTAEGHTVVAGTAFLLEVGGKLRLVTAHHVFGQGGGLPREIAWQDMPRKVQGVRCIVFAHGREWRAGAPLALPGAAPGTDVEAMTDVAAFPIEVDLVSRPAALRLAATPAKVGDTVWLVTSLASGAPPEQLLHRARVGRVTGGGTVLFVYDNPAVDIRATSGAPVVNARGEVVGVNFGGGERQGRAFGIATGLATVRTMLAGAQ